MRCKKNAQENIMVYWAEHGNPPSGVCGTQRAQLEEYFAFLSVLVQTFPGVWAASQAAWGFPFDHIMASPAPMRQSLP